MVILDLPFLGLGSLSLPPIRRDIRYQPFLEGNLLNFPGSVPNVDHEPVDLDYPNHRIILKYGSASSSLGQAGES